MLAQVVIFLAEALCSFFGIVFLARFAMQAQRISFYSSLGQFVLRLSDWLVLPLRRVLPGLFGYDLASLFAAWLSQLAFASLRFYFLPHFGESDPGLVAAIVLWAATLGLLRLVLHAIVGLLLLQAILSWVNPYSPLAAPLGRLTAPLLNPIRRLLPPISGIDLSPLVAILLAQVLLMLL